MEEARARARNNATWWSGLTSEQRQALIETHPQHIGNAEGIPAADRHTANHRVLQQLRDRADQVQARIDEGARPSRADRKFLQQVNRLDLALRKASADAARVGVDGPVLLAFDPAEFGGDGRAVLSFGRGPLPGGLGVLACARRRDHGPFTVRLLHANPRSITCSPR